MYRNKQQREFARTLRSNQTDAERKLWSLLRCEQLAELKFRRQAAIGDYIVDFVCFAEKMIVELDGGQHNDLEIRKYDDCRSNWLSSQGFRIVRFWNFEVLEDAEAVVAGIWKALQESSNLASPLPNPPHQAEGA
jgi:very-short-patch-repair endonuclease